MELITTPLAIIAGIIMVGIIVEICSEGWDNVGVWHQFIGIICVVIVAVTLLT
jgi:hypothetical protein